MKFISVRRKRNVQNKLSYGNYLQLTKINLEKDRKTFLIQKGKHTYLPLKMLNNFGVAGESEIAHFSVDIRL